jgi:hypothetical protein
MTVAAASETEVAALPDAAAYRYAEFDGVDVVDLDVVDAVAIESFDFKFLTIYIADHAIDREPLGLHPPVVEQGELLLEAHTVIEGGTDQASFPSPIDAGDVIYARGAGSYAGPPRSRAVRRFMVLIRNGDDSHDDASDPSGQLVIHYVSDDRICFSIDYTSIVTGTEFSSRTVSRRIEGTFAAELLHGPSSP